MSKRIGRTNDDILHVLSVKMREIKDPRLHQGLVTITAVETTNDLSFTTVYLSILGDCDEKRFQAGLKSASGFLRRELGRALKVRHTPELIFKLDSSMARGAEITEILRGLEVSADGDDTI